MFDRLIEDHRRIAGLADAIAAALASPLPPACPASFARLRWQFTRELLQHLTVEERMIAERGGSSRGIDLGARLRKHIADWTADGIGADWGGYRRETERLLADLRSRIRHEEEVIYPALRRSDAARAQVRAEPTKSAHAIRY